MPTSSKKELQQEIQDLKDALESEFTPAQFKDDIRKQIRDSEAELDKLEKAESQVKTASAEKKPQKVEKKETAAQRVKKRVEQAKKTVKIAKKKQEEAKQEKKTALQKIKERKEKRAAAKKPVRKSAPKKSSLSKKRDAERKALKAGRRVSADGNVYYENRSNRSDVQRRKYPYLEDGGFTNDGAGMFAGGGRIVDFEVGDNVIIESGYSQYDGKKAEVVRIMPDNKTLELKIKHKVGNEYIKFEKNEVKKYAEGGTTDFTNDGAGMFARGGGIKDYEEKSREMRATILAIQKSRINPADVSPEFAKEMADDLGMPITEKEAIKISKGFGYEGKYAKGGIFGSNRNLARDRMFKSQEDWEQRYKRKSRPKNPAYQKHEMGGELHKTEFAEGGVIVDYTEGLYADPRFDINSPMFARGGKLSNKYNYLPKYQIATITTEDGAVIDGNDIIDGVYVKKKVKF